MSEMWYAIVATKDHPEGYKKGEVYSYGTVVDFDGLEAKGLKAVPLGKREASPDFSDEKWDQTQEKLVKKTAEEKAAEGS